MQRETWLRLAADIVSAPHKDIATFRHHDINHTVIITAHTMNLIQLPNLANDCNEYSCLCVAVYWRTFPTEDIVR